MASKKSKSYFLKSNGKRVYFMPTKEPLPKGFNKVFIPYNNTEQLNARNNKVVAGRMPVKNTGHVQYVHSDKIRSE